MNEKFLNWRRVKIIFALALFSFLFLGTEYMFDNMIAYTTDARNVVIAQSYVLGASVVGFLLFPVFSRLTKGNTRYFMIFAGAIISIICLFIIQQRDSYGAVLIAGCVVFALLGITGNMVHCIAAVMLGKDKNLAKTVGTSYAMGLLFQFISNNFVNNDKAEAIVLSLFLAVFAMMLIHFMYELLMPCAEGTNVEGESRYVLKHPLGAAGILTICVVLMTCIFATLDNVVTLVHATGSVDIGQWPRLLLAVSGLLAGVLFDIKEHSYMNIIMYCVTVLSTICVVVIEFGGPFLVGLIVFYISAGFFVVYFTTGYMNLSHYMKVPELWAGIGRAVNNLCAGFIGTVSLTIIESGDGIVICVCALVLFVLISIATFAYSAQFERNVAAEGKDETTESKAEDEGARFAKFSETFSLTQREQEVLTILLHSDDNVQDIAEKLFISRAALYRHIASLNEKTQTKSRVGLLQFYFNWNEAGEE